MTGAQQMTWIMDEYETITQAHQPGVITGKPVTAGGSRGRAQATGYGLVYTLREALKELDLRPDQTRASVQGFGSVARHAIELYQQIGGRVVCVSSWDQAESTSHAFRKTDGVDLKELIEISDAFGGIDRSRAESLGYEVLPGEAWLQQNVEILIPAALEHQITQQNVGSIGTSVRLVAEGANGPTTPEAEKVLLERGVVIIPDIVANAGGMVCSYFEHVQNNMNYSWELAEVLGKLDMRLTAAFIEISDLATSKGLSMRDAALLLAINRVATVCHQRGWV
jgi:glutamate dehydrogenase (NAD(P)+)